MSTQPPWPSVHGGWHYGAIRRGMAHEWPVAFAAVPPATAALIAGLLPNVTVSDGVWAALIVAIAEQQLWGYAAVRHAKLSGPALTRTMLLNVFDGLDHRGPEVVHSPGTDRRHWARVAQTSASTSGLRAAGDTMPATATSDQHHQQRVQQADVLADEADQRRADQEREVADGRHRTDPGRGVARIVGGRRHPDREAERRAETPQHHTDAGQPGASARRSRRPDRPRRTRRTPAAPEPGRTGRAGRRRRPGRPSWPSRRCRKPWLRWRCRPRGRRPWPARASRWPSPRRRPCPARSDRSAASDGHARCPAGPANRSSDFCSSSWPSAVPL